MSSKSSTRSEGVTCPRSGPNGGWDGLESAEDQPRLDDCSAFCMHLRCRRLNWSNTHTSTGSAPPPVLGSARWRRSRQEASPNGGVAFPPSRDSEISCTRKRSMASADEPGVCSPGRPRRASSAGISSVQPPCCMYSPSILSLQAGTAGSYEE